MDNDLRQQNEPLNLSNQNNTKEFYRWIGKLGLANERQNSVSMEVRMPSGDIWHSLWNMEAKIWTTIQHKWRRIRRKLPILYKHTLNSDITYEDVEKAVYRVKLNKACGLDQIFAKFVRNTTCVQMLYRMIKFAFDNEVVPKTWNQISINPILKPDKGNRDPLRYRGLALMSIPCKIYADILNWRLSTWLEDNDLLADEQNGFRKERSCLYYIRIN